MMPIQLKNILCAIDFSQHTPSMLRYSVWLAKRTGARLLVFHTVLYPEDDVYISPVAGQGTNLRASSNRAIARMARIMKPYNVEWRPLIRYGSPVDQAPRAARENEADLVVTVSHGFSKLKRLLWGAVVERMARELNRPLLVIRPEKRAQSCEARSPLTPQRIVVGCDLTSTMAPTLAYAGFFAEVFNAEVHLLHTLESPLNEDLVDRNEGRYGAVQQRLQERSSERLTALYANQRYGNHPFTVIIASGLPEEALIHHARQQDAKLIIVGVKWRGAINRFLVGSTTEAVIRHSPCPVLVVPPNRRT